MSRGIQSKKIRYLCLISVFVAIELLLKLPDLTAGRADGQ